MDDVPVRRLLLFAKVPEPGRVKTRLIPRLGADGAARLYEAFLDDMVDTCRGIPDARFELWTDGERAEATGSRATGGYFSGRYPDLAIRRQPDGDLGERLSGAFAATFAADTDYAVITGGDHPTLPAALLERAFAALIGAHLVIGPSEDGGYYLIGLRRYAWPAAAGLFDGVPWSTPGVLDTTRERARRLDLCHVELPSWYDVDAPDDLVRLRRETSPGSRTRQVLEHLSAAPPH